MPTIDPTIEPIDTPNAPGNGVAIALSGGGYRAMLFHTGALWRLGQLGFFAGAPLARIDPTTGAQHVVGQLERISSVSGGSILSGVFALAYSHLAGPRGTAFDAPYVAHVVAPIRKLASVNLAGWNVPGAFQVIKDVLLPGRVSAHIATAYDRHLYNGKTLQDLPDAPRFVFNASNLQSGALWRFSKKYMRDWRVGEVPSPTLPMAKVIAASSAFPPILAPCVLSLKDEAYTPASGGTGKDNLQHAPYTTRPTLADGGVYDNLGLETCYKRYRTLFVSNAGKPFERTPSVKSNWLSIGNRCLDVMDNQVLAQRKRMLVQAFVAGQRFGAFWDIEQSIAVHRCGSALPCPSARTQLLAQVPTDLAEKSGELQEHLINWGYAVTDAAVRGWFNPGYPAGTFPYARGL